MKTHDTQDDVAILMPAKLSSTRLPRKHLLEIKGKPVIQHLIERVKSHTGIKKIILCITENDAELEEIAEKSGILWHRGKAGSVLKQYADVVQKYSLRYVVNVDCDDLLVNFDLINRTASIMESLEDSVDFLTWDGYPLGCAPYGMSGFGITWLDRNTSDDVEYIWKLFQKSEDLQKVAIQVTSKELSKPYVKDIRLTLDYIEDFRLFEIIYNRLYERDHHIHYDNLMRFIDQNPHLVEVNKHMNTAYREHQHGQDNKKTKI